VDTSSRAGSDDWTDFGGYSRSVDLRWRGRTWTKGGR
jgi:hypothetical protein